MSEKQELLEGYNDYLDLENDLTLRDLWHVLLTFLIVLLFMISKIYVSNNIYYKSLELERKKEELIILEDEKRELKTKLELLKFNAKLNY